MMNTTQPKTPRGMLRLGRPIQLMSVLLAVAGGTSARTSTSLTVKAEAPQ